MEDKPRISSKLSMPFFINTSQASMAEDVAFFRCTCSKVGFGSQQVVLCFRIPVTKRTALVEIPLEVVTCDVTGSVRFLSFSLVTSLTQADYRCCGFDLNVTMFLDFLSLLKHGGLLESC